VAQPLKILYVTSELAPLVSTGGLAEVAAALPRALRARGHDVRVALPCYRQIPAAVLGEQYCMVVAELGGKAVHGAMRASVMPGTDIPLYLIEHEGYFGRQAPYGVGAYEFDDNGERFCFFCQALFHGIRQTGWMPDVIHCNDWHGAPIAIYLKTRYRRDPFWGRVPCLFTIHNLAHQGRYAVSRFGATGFDPALLAPGCLLFDGDMNFMRGAILFADTLSTVSPRYAKEIQTAEYGCGLDEILGARSADLYGVLNGVDYDVWNPATDPNIACPYSAESPLGKAECKAALQRRFDLPVRDVPLFGAVSRLYWQKGFDFVLDAMDRMMAHDAQLVVLGSGDPWLEGQLSGCVHRYPGRVGVFLGYDAALSHQVVAGSDFFLMPSRYEPCGLAQMYSLAYGNLPIVRRTGGLADTVVDATPANLRRGTATGLSFVPKTAAALARAVDRAVALYADPEAMGQLRHAGMTRDFSWGRSCEAYEALYRKTARSVL
jgi:starch synthase